MSEQHEPSYYEIALTGRQVLVAFVVLLVCVLAAFFSGVWVGRDGTPNGTGRAAEVLANANPGLARSGDSAGEVASGQDEPEFEELSFFDSDGSESSNGDPEEQGSTSPEPTAARVIEPPPQQARQEPKPSRDTTLAQDVGAAPPAAARLGAESQLSTTRPEPARRDPAKATTEPSRPTQEPAKSPTPAPAPTTTKAPTKPTTALPGSGDLVIQVLVTGEKARADQTVSQLVGKGFRAFLSPVQQQGKTLYRVRVGPFEERARAETVAARIQSELGLETWITR